MKKLLLIICALFLSVSALGQRALREADLPAIIGQTPNSITNLSSGTALTVRTNYYDTFSTDRTFTITGTPAEGNQITVYATMSADVVLTFPSVKRLLEPAAAAEAVYFPPGFHIISLIYRNAAWWLVDSATPLSNTAATAAPAVTNDLDEGYEVGSFWLDTTADNAYICLDNSNGAAVWAKVDTDGSETVTFTNKTIDPASNTVPLNTITSRAAPTTTNPYTLTAANSYGAVLHYGATGEIDLPALADGMNIIIYNTGAFTITIDPNVSEVIVRDGTVQTGGVSFTLSSGAGNYVALYSDGTNWITLGYKGTLSVGS